MNIKKLGFVSALALMGMSGSAYGNEKIENGFNKKHSDCTAKYSNGGINIPCIRVFNNKDENILELSSLNLKTSEDGFIISSLLKLDKNVLLKNECIATYNKVENKIVIPCLNNNNKSYKALLKESNDTFNITSKKETPRKLSRSSSYMFWNAQNLPYSTTFRINGAGWSNSIWSAKKFYHNGEGRVCVTVRSNLDYIEEANVAIDFYKDSYGFDYREDHKEFSNNEGVTYDFWASAGYHYFRIISYGQSYMNLDIYKCD